MSEKIVLAYSGGLDTSVAIRWLQEHYGADIATLTMDLGGKVDLETARQRALDIGAIRADILDAREEFIDEYVWPALQAGALYEGVYPLATALGRPLIAKHLVRIALEESAFAIAHGCTGKGNDQVRFDVSAIALAPAMKVIAPAREWGMTRDDEIAYAQKNQIPLEINKRSAYSVDENIWGRSIEAGDLENPWMEPPEDAYAWTVSVPDAPESPEYIEITFETGIPVAINGEKLKSVSLVENLNEIAGKHGVGRIDHIENRLVGIKSREIYEAPAGHVLHQAHKSLEQMCLSKEQTRFKDRVSQEYADIVYNGLWFTAHRENLDAYIKNSQSHVNGIVRTRLHKGTSTVVGRSSDESLYQHNLATYDAGDTFDHQASVGFISVFGLPVKTQAEIQGGEAT
ncbi:MAG: argininosuccinate synthase [Dehalococcoidia bacterium]|nr:argininosuccinate synthase [Dehalococcoidia bacterium]|tara:strand:- start:2531 stop:3733 length:1203 start_codon:yes stop_codon:yes gene_type:complete